MRDDNSSRGDRSIPLVYASRISHCFALHIISLCIHLFICKILIFLYIMYKNYRNYIAHIEDKHKIFVDKCVIIYL